jgi:hypothetical protein
MHEPFRDIPSQQPLEAEVQSTVLKLDTLRIQTNPSLQEFVLCQNLLGLNDSASVAENTRHFEDLSDLRVSDLRTASCTTVRIVKATAIYRRTSKSGTKKSTDNLPA